VDRTVSALRAMFEPDSIAVVGASPRRGSIGQRVLSNLQRDFTGRLYAVNPSHAEVNGVPAFPSVAALPERVDLLLITVPAERVPDVVQTGAAAGHRSAYVISSGFAEAGAAGARLQEQLATTARTHAFPVAGPNCIGYLNGYRTTAAGFMNASAERPVPGSVALVSQSGGFGSFLLQMSRSAGVRVGFFASTGNEVDVSVTRIAAHVLEWPQVRVLMLFAEALRDPDGFVAAARRAWELDKVIVAVRPDTSAAVRRAVRHHTASQVGSSEVFDSVCDQYGVLRADSFDEMLDFAKLLQDGRRMRSNRLGLVSVSGGAGVMMSGAAARVGLQVPELSAAVQADIAPLVPKFAAVSNPVDVTAALGGSGFPASNLAEVATKILTDGGVDALVTVLFEGRGATAQAVRAVYEQHDKPMAAVIALDPDADPDAPVPVFTDPVRAVHAMGAVRRVSSRGAAPADAPVLDAGRQTRARRLLAEHRGADAVSPRVAARLMALYGLPGAGPADGAGPEPVGKSIVLELVRDPTFGAVVRARPGAGAAGSGTLLRPPFDRGPAEAAVRRALGLGSATEHDRSVLDGLARAMAVLALVAAELVEVGRLEVAYGVVGSAQPCVHRLGLWRQRQPSEADDLKG